MAKPTKSIIQTSPTRGRSRGEKSKPSTRARSPRTACNFCHDKRVKCVMPEGGTRCEQCAQRNTSCVFSTKAKTGPKPKTVKAEEDGASRNKAKNSRRSVRRVRGPAHSVSILPKRGGGGANGTSFSSSCSFSSSISSASYRDFEAGGSATPTAMTPAAAAATTAAAAVAAAAVAQPPVAANTVTADNERVYLGIYAGTIGRFVPLVPEEVLSACLRERQRIPLAMADAVGNRHVACEQAQVVGAISLGALISGHVKAAQAYHLSLRYHLGNIRDLTHKGAVPSLALGALYWQHRGVDELKSEWVVYARRVLGNVQNIPADLILSIEYLDYAHEAHPRPGIDLLPANRKALHSISCLLANMPSIVSPDVGRAAAVASCDELHVCVLGLIEEPSAELALLLCKSLRALLLAMLGQREAAIETLATIPALVDPASGGNPSVIRALPLSWDALLIASALSFLLGQGGTYQRLRGAVELATDVPADARWAFCLPEPGSDVRDYVVHECRSSSNICAIMCGIARKTAFGGRPFYPEEEEPQAPPGQHYYPAAAAAAVVPAVIASLPGRHQRLHHNPAARHNTGEHRYGYGYEGKAAARRIPSDLRGNLPAADSISGGGGGGGGAAISFLHGDLGDDGMIAAGEGAAAADAMSDRVGFEEAPTDFVAYKRRRVVSGNGGGGSPGPSNGNGSVFLHERGGCHHQHASPQPYVHPVYGSVLDPSGHSYYGDNEGFDYDNSYSNSTSSNSFNATAPPAAGAFAGATSGANGRGSGHNPGGGGSCSGGIGGDGDLDRDGLGLARDLHNMSLSRLSGPLGGLQDDPRRLGRVPSEDIMELSSSLGSFAAMDMVGLEDGGGTGGEPKTGDRAGSFTRISQASNDDGERETSFGGVEFPAAKASSGGGGSNGGDVTNTDVTPLLSVSGSKPPLRLGSFSNYSAMFRRASSSSMLPLARDDASIGQCGSDLGHDIGASADDFLDEDGNGDICGNILSVDAMLRDVSVPRGSGGSSKSGSGAGGGGAAAPPEADRTTGVGGPLLASGFGSAGDVSPLLDEHKISMSTKALADFYEAG